MKARIVVAMIAMLASPAAAQTTPPRTTGQPWRCGEKTYCTQMVSCEEATFHFRQCGLARLDRDRDGVPCETLCGQSRRRPRR